MPKKLLIILLIMVIAAGAVIGGIFAWRYWQNLKEEAKPANNKYVNQKYGFEIIPPSRWKMKEMTDNNITFYNPKLGEKNLYIILSISITEEPAEDLESYVNDKKSRLTPPEYEFHASSQIKIGDVEAYELVYTLTAEIKSALKTSREPFRKFKAIFLMKNNRRFRIAYVVTPSEYQAYLPIVEQSIKSFKFID